MVLVGKKAPEVKGAAVVKGYEVVENFDMEAYKGKYVILFFYPADFTFVCPTEILSFQERLNDFQAKNCEIVGVSVDSEFSHWKWLQTPLNEGGIKGVTFPLVADQSLQIAKNYDVLAGAENYTDEGEEYFEGVARAYRGLFLIDKEGVVRHQVVNDMPLGRSVDEAIRVLDALQYTEEYGEVCPANWKKGDKAMKATQEGVADYLSKK